MRLEQLQRRTVTVRLWLLVALCLGLVAVGLWSGLRSSWGAQPTQQLEGLAMRANDENDLVLFEADDGTQATFRGEAVAWTAAGSVRGYGSPPCLRRPLAKARVEIGQVQAATPDGLRWEQVVWVRCR